MSAPDTLAERLGELLAKATPGPWEVHDSCSWRRIGTRERDGDVLCPTKHYRDGHPDLTAFDGRLYDNLELIVAAINALPTLLAERKTMREAFDWLAEHPRCSLDHFGPVYGDDDDQSTGWRVMRENGSINDREWTEIGRGDTPLSAIQSALKGQTDGE